MWAVKSLACGELALLAHIVYVYYVLYKILVAMYFVLRFRVLKCLLLIRRWDDNMIADYCWSIKRECSEHIHRQKSKKDASNL